MAGSDAYKVTAVGGSQGKRGERGGRGGRGGKSPGTARGGRRGGGSRRRGRRSPAKGRGMIGSAAFLENESEEKKRAVL